MKQIRSTVFFVMAVLASLMLTGCQKQTETTLRIAVLPIMDTLPFYVAEEQGYFQDEGIEIELLPVKSPIERDAMIQANEADGMLTDVPGVGIFNRDQVQVKIVSLARKSYPESPLFRLLAAPNSDIQSVNDLAGVEIGISQNTTIEYITDRMLEKSGLLTEQIEITEVTAIPVRYEQLMAGQIAAATLPDPQAQGAIAAGAKLVIDDSQFAGLSQSVLVFTLEALDNKPETVARFIRAWNHAAADLNENPANYRDLLIEKGRVPKEIQGSFSMPPFPEAEITSPAQWDDVLAWLLEKELVEREIPYSEAVDQSFLE